MSLSYDRWRADSTGKVAGYIEKIKARGSPGEENLEKTEYSSPPDKMR